MQIILINLITSLTILYDSPIDDEILIEKNGLNRRKRDLKLKIISDHLPLIFIIPTFRESLHLFYHVSKIR